MVRRGGGRRRGRRAIVGGLLAAATLAAACTSASEGQPDGGQDDAARSGDEQDDATSEPVPVDEDVVVGTLDSGLTYYVRENDDPGGRAQLRLAVRAGSVNETDEQSGGAHYLEHMLFNGTEEYPANELTDVLADFGAQFGPDINAYTSYDETVYMLEAETADDEEVEVGIEVLAQWASAATIDPEEVDAERGVVTEERRLHLEDADGRLEELSLDVLTGGTAYEDHDTIGTPESLEELSADDLRDFYETWYQPEQMAVVVVGDVDADDVVELIEDTFDGVFDDDGGSDAERPERLAPDDPTHRALEDAELDRAHLQLFLPTEPLDLDTLDGRAEALRRDVVARMLANRLGNDILRGDLPILTAEVESLSGSFLLHDALAVSIEADNDDLDAAVDGGLEAVELARRGGFDEAELERAVAELAAEIEDLEQSARQDDWFAGLYVDHFLGYGSMPSVEDGIELDLETLDDLTLDDVDELAASLPPPSALVAGPDLAALGDDPEAELAARAEAVAEADLEPREPEPPVPDELMARPEGGEIVDTDRSFIQTTYRLGNGATVIAVPAANLESVYIEAFSPGGWSVLPDPDVVAATVAPGIAARSDLGDLERLEVDAFLAETSVVAEPLIDEFSEGVQGGALPDDLEALVALTRLYLTDVRFTDGAARLELGELRTQAAHPELDADVASLIALTDAYYSGSVRHRLLPSLDELESFDVAAAERIYAERFADASDLTFVIVGAYDDDELEELVTAYFGTLPSSGGGAEQWVDAVPPFPAGVTTRRVEAGSGDKGSVQLLWSADVPVDGTTVVTSDLIRTILTTRLLDQVREELGASYSPAVEIEGTTIPRPTVQTYVRIDGDPDEVATLSEVAREVIADLATDGPTDDELDQATEQLRRDYELSTAYDRGQWVIEGLGNEALGLDFYYEERDRLLGRIDADQVRDLASKILPADTYLEVVQVPDPRDAPGG